METYGLSLNYTFYSIIRWICWWDDQKHPVNSIQEAQVSYCSRRHYEKVADEKSKKAIFNVHV